MTALLSSTYFGPVQWYQKLNRYPVIFIEQHDSYQKQTYRNRCVIATTNGLQTLTVPVERGRAADDAVGADCGRAVRISDHGNWRHLHWHALMSAYNESPFFEYYADDLRPFFERRWDSLYDFNLDICRMMCELLDIHPEIRLTDEYVPKSRVSCCLSDGDTSDAETLHRYAGAGRSRPADSGFPPVGKCVTDFREVINPKHPLPDADFRPRRYYQVYERKHGFQPNLSILDLLFNMGPESIYYL